MAKSPRAQTGQPSRAELEEARELLHELELYAKHADPSGTLAEKVRKVRNCFFQEGEE